MNTRSTGKRVATGVTTMVGLFSVATTIVASLMLWNQTPIRAAATTTTGTSSGPTTGQSPQQTPSDSGQSGSTDDDGAQPSAAQPSTAAPAPAPQVVTPSQGGAPQAQSSGS